MVPALLYTARLGNFRLGYVPTALDALRRTSVSIRLGGVEARTRVRIGSLTVHDGLNDTPNTCSLVFQGTPPPADVADLRIAIGTDNPTLLFNGTLQTRDLTYDRRPDQLAYPCTAIDDTGRANRRRPFGKWVGVSATTIAQYLIATFAPGFTSYGVAAGLPLISVTFDGSEGFAGALRQIAKLIGGYYYFENLDLHLFQTEASAQPDPIDATHSFLDDPPIRITRDFSQLRTRVYGRGMGAALLSDVAAGDALVPIADATSFNPAGGKAIAESQRLTYSGTQLGGAGSAVGPGAAPANAPLVAPASGSGIEDGAHQWAVTFQTASGESLPGPVALLTTGPLAAPLTAPTLAAPTIGSGPEPGTHTYAVGFVTATGETLAGPTVTQSSGLTLMPTTAPTVAAAPGTGIDDGFHDYAVSFVTAIGETIPGPITAAIQVGPLPAPTAGPVAGVPLDGVGPDEGGHYYLATFVTSQGETTAGAYIDTPVVTGVSGTPVPPPTVAPVLSALHPTFSSSPSGAWVIGASVRWAVTYCTDVAGTRESTLGPPSAAWTITTGPAGAPNTSIPNVSYYAARPLVGGLADARVVTGYLYESFNGGPFYRRGFLTWGGGFDTAFSTYSHTGTTPPPVTNGAFPPQRQVPLTGIPIGGASVMLRKLYRWSAGGPFKLLATLYDNTTTTFLDTILNAALGAVPPAVNTAGAWNQIQLTAIPTGDANVSSRKLYRRSGGAGFKLLATLANNSTTSYLDATPSLPVGGSPGAAISNGNAITTAAASAATSAAAAFSTPTTGNYNTANTAATSAANTLSTALSLTAAGTAAYALVTKGIADYQDSAVKLALCAAAPADTAKRTAAQSAVATASATAALAAAAVALPGLGLAPLVTSTAYLQRIAISAIPLGGALVTARRLYRTVANGAQLKLLTTIVDNTTTAFLDVYIDAVLGGDAPVAGTAMANQATLTSIPLGPASTTGRRLWRTVAGGTQLKLLGAIANNTTTGPVTDATADGALGVNAPAADTSGLTQPTGQVLAGSTTLPVASAGLFAVTGGWVTIGSQTVRYTGISGNNLTGVPSTGLPGSLVNTVRFGEHVDAAPVLVGVAGLTQAALKGITVSIWVQREDVAAQAAMVALDLAQGRVTDGVYEYRISDERRAEASLIALCDADLAQFSRPIVTVVYATRDLKTKAGKPVVINLASPPVAETLTIQDVAISEIDMAINVAPRFMVTASSVRYSLEDLLRQMAATVGV